MKNPKLRLKVGKKGEVLRSIRNLRRTIEPLQKEEEALHLWSVKITNALNPLRRKLHSLQSEYGLAKFLTCPARVVWNDSSFYGSPPSYSFGCELEKETQRSYMNPERKRRCYMCALKRREVYAALLGKKLEGKKKKWSTY